MHPICIDCAHWDPDDYDELDDGSFVEYCKAFPRGTPGIPKEIMDGDRGHDQPYPGDNGVRFESAPDPEPLTGSDPGT